MTKKEIARVNINGHDAAYWKDEIHKKLDMSPQSFDKLAESYGFKKYSQPYADLLVVVSSMQNRGRGKPTLASQFNRDEGNYLLYLTKQESELVEEGLLPKPTVVDLKREINLKEYDLPRGRHFEADHGTER